MKPSAVSRALRALVIQEEQPVFIWGSPGTGKSAVVNQLAAELEIALRDIRALLLDPVDMRGLPFIGKDGRSQWATPDFLPQDGEGILFLDGIERRARDGPGQLLSTRAGSQTRRIYLAGRMGNCRGRESRFRPCRYDADAYTLAEPVRSHRLRGGRAGMVRVGDQDGYPARGHRLHSFPSGIAECL